jgi:hypothetical protein
VGSGRPKCANSCKISRKNFSFLNFGLGRREISGGYFVSEIAFAVRAIAEGLVCGMSAAAETDGSASGQAEFISGWINNLEIAFDKDRAVVFESNFCWHLFPFESL